MHGLHHCLHDEGAVTLLVACSALKRAETEVRWCTEAVNGGYGATLYNLSILVILLITTCQLILYRQGTKKTIINTTVRILRDYLWNTTFPTAERFLSAVVLS